MCAYLLLHSTNAARPIVAESYPQKKKLKKIVVVTHTVSQDRDYDVVVLGEFSNLEQIAGSPSFL